MPVTVIIKLHSKFEKFNDEQQIAFGWFSVIEEGGQQVIDKQDDIIDECELEKTAYDYTFAVGIAGDMHEEVGVGRLVESMVFTKEKQKALGIDLGKIGWWGGLKITDQRVWKAVKDGHREGFSIAGKAEAYGEEA